MPDVTGDLQPFDAAMAEWRRHGYSDAWLYLELRRVFGARVASLEAELADVMRQAEYAEADVTRLVSRVATAERG